MPDWKHLFLKGEFPDRERVLTGLTPEQASALPDGASHSVYQELWHVTRWQDIVLSRVESRVHAWIEDDVSRFPAAAGPASAEEWNALVDEFLAGLRRAVAIAEAGDGLTDEVAPGVTFSDVLVSLAVHDAYHLGKIVALRQRMGCWT
jgi:hypothetical protein